MKMLNPGRREGFTLIELLVVTAVTAILAVMLMPALSRAREQAPGTDCGDNLRQLGSALHMYASDWGDYMPAQQCAGGDRWNTTLIDNGYVPEVERLQCPSWPANGVTTTYGMRQRRARDDFYPEESTYSSSERDEEHFRLTKLHQDIYTHGDTVSGDTGTQTWLFRRDGDGVTAGTQSQLIHLRHGGTANLLFPDGRAEPAGLGRFAEVNQIHRSPATSYYTKDMGIGRVND